MFTPLHRKAPRRRGALLLLASLLLNLLSASPSPVVVAAPRRAPAQASAAPFVRVLGLPVNDVVYDKQSKRLYASVPSSAGAVGNSVTEIDPATGALGASVYVGSEPNRLAVSEDGLTVYVGLDGAASVRRVDMATHTATTQFRLGREQFTGTAFTSGDLAVVPGDPNAVAIARLNTSSTPGAGVAVYDNGVPRPNVATNVGDNATYLAFGATAATLYGSQQFGGGLKKMSVDGNGATTVGVTPFTYAGEIQFEGGRLYNDRGQVYNPATDALAGTFANAGFSSAFAVDAAVGRAFYVVNAVSHNSDPVIVRAYDLNTFQPVGEISIGGVVGTVTGLVRWGSNGLAFRTGNNQLYLVQTALVPSPDPVPDATPTPSPTPTPTPAPVEASVRHLPLVTKELAYVPPIEMIYASVPAVAGASGNSVVRIDPAAATAGTPVFVGSDPNKLAVADDGHTLYVGLNGASSVRRFDTATQTAGPQFFLGTAPANPISDGFYTAADLAVMPGSPGTVAVCRIAGAFNSSTSLSVYDEGVKRPNDSNGVGTEIEFPTPARIYSAVAVFGAGVQRNAVTASGVTFESSSSVGKGGTLKYANGLIYTSNGSVYDPETGDLKGTFSLGETGSSPPIMTVDAALGRAYFFSILSSGGRLRVYDINTFLPLGELSVPYKSEPVEGMSFEYTSLLRWGSNGLAFRTASHVTFVQSALIGPGSFPAPTPTPTPSPTPSPTPQLPTFVRQIDLPARDVIYSPTTQKLYASVSGAVGSARGDSITPIDPATGALGASVFTGPATEPDKLALSDDGLVLYLGYNGINTPRGPGAVRRLDLNTQTLGPDISLGTDPNFGGPQWAYDIAVAPGNPNLIAVARYTGSSPPQKGVALFDNGVQLPKTTPGHTEGSVSVAFSASPATLYGGSTEAGLKTIAVDATGATVTNTAPFRFGPNVEFKNGLLYSTQGQVLNPATGLLLGRFGSGTVLGRAMAIDPALNRAFLATGSDFGSAPITITAYDLTTFAPVGRVTLPFSGSPTRLMRWGANGLALRAAPSTFAATEGKVYLVQSALVSAAAPVPTGVQLASTGTTVLESNTSAAFNVVRTGDLSVASTVEYATADGTASERSDYTTALGTLRFAPGESTKTIRVLLTNDFYQEGDEKFGLTLFNPSGAELTSPANAAATIQDDDFFPQEGNPVDGTSFFVRQHYRDFLNRLPDTPGLVFWTGEINSCGQDEQCREVKRVNVSAAFFLSIEFQRTGYLVYRLHQASFATGETLGMRPFLKDTQEIGQGIVVGAEGWEAQLETNTRDFIARFVARPEFAAAYPSTLTPAQFVDALNANTGGSLTQAERDGLVAELTAGTKTRADVLRAVAENPAFSRRQFNRAFVYMQYVGYLRRNPNATPDTDFAGYNFWLKKLDDFNGNYIDAELVKAFLTSIEYRKRFAP